MFPYQSRSSNFCTHEIPSRHSTPAGVNPTQCHRAIEPPDVGAAQSRDRCLNRPVHGAFAFPGLRCDLRNDVVPWSMAGKRPRLRLTVLTVQAENTEPLGTR